MLSANTFRKSRCAARTRLLHAVTAVAMAATLWACTGPTAPVAPAPPPTSTTYHLGTGDKVRVTVYGEQNLSGEYSVDSSGTLTLPLVGNVKVAGLTSDELKEHLQQRYKEYLKTPDVSIQILDYRPFYIVGEVKNPGKYPYVNGMTVINAVAIAGGFTYRANSDNFYIQRKGKADHQFSAQQATEIRPGDVVVVRERFF